MAHNIHLSALEDLWSLVMPAAERELKSTFQRLIDPTESELPFELDDPVSVKCRKLKTALLTALPDCSAEGQETLRTMLEVTGSDSYTALVHVFTTLRALSPDDSDSD